MDVLSTLLIKLAPLYILIPLGYLASRFLKTPKEPIATLLIYIITPVVIFDGTLTAELSRSMLLLPFVSYILCCSLCIVAYLMARLVWTDSTKNIAAFTSGTGNTGYFGLPVALMLFGENVLGTYVMALFGFILYENTLGFFITARGNHGIEESMKKVLRLPTVYAFFIGLLLNALNTDFGYAYADMAKGFRGTYTVLGMMIIGIALSDFRRFAFDKIFLFFTFIAKFVAWPLIVGLLVFVDATTIGMFSVTQHHVLLLLAIVPLAANTVTLASALHAQPEKSSLAVLLSTIFALVYIPVFALLFF